MVLYVWSSDVVEMMERNLLRWSAAETEWARVLLQKRFSFFVLYGEKRTINLVKMNKESNADGYDGHIYIF